MISLYYITQMNKKDFGFGIFVGVTITAMIMVALLAVGLFAENRKLDASASLWQNARNVLFGNPNLTNAGADTQESQDVLEYIASLTQVNISLASDELAVGSPDNPVKLIVYFDAQCPVYARFHTVLRQALEKYSDKIYLVMRHFPLDSIHPQARPAANAIECAREQSQGWEFLDALMQSGQTFDTTLFNSIASQLGLKSGDFDRCLTARTYNSRVQAQADAGEQLGVSGTPNWFLNGKLVGGAMSIADLSKVIESL